ncbi:unnamed protein product [Vitrella brassicaformis CCMP3155]|uniref:Uncharacterized protein n=1 Tax=Vitrella brassicaformis (strain CCMP3155) TaxID=1169540 RepID=A0A0G4EZP1_VITBC|nr:unnamed protein product [Vitrella brassicaformis CCMP3155]|eukprot:CEM05004.1 unnamed protein product [Vitrella brassicaformis CCMP3155]
MISCSEYIPTGDDAGADRQQRHWRQPASPLAHDTATTGEECRHRECKHPQSRGVATWTASGRREHTRFNGLDLFHSYMDTFGAAAKLDPTPRRCPIVVAARVCLPVDPEQGEIVADLLLHDELSREVLLSLPKQLLLDVGDDQTWEGKDEAERIEIAYHDVATSAVASEGRRLTDPEERQLARLMEPDGGRDDAAVQVIGLHKPPEWDLPTLQNAINTCFESLNYDLYVEDATPPTVVRANEGEDVCMLRCSDMDFATLLLRMRCLHLGVDREMCGTNAKPGSSSIYVSETYIELITWLQERQHAIDQGQTSYAAFKPYLCLPKLIDDGSRPGVAPNHPTEPVAPPPLPPPAAAAAAANSDMADSSDAANRTPSPPAPAMPTGPPAAPPPAAPPLPPAADSEDTESDEGRAAKRKKGQAKGKGKGKKGGLAAATRAANKSLDLLAAEPEAAPKEKTPPSVQHKAGPSAERQQRPAIVAKAPPPPLLPSSPAAATISLPTGAVRPPAGPLAGRRDNLPLKQGLGAPVPIVPPPKPPTATDNMPLAAAAAAAVAARARPVMVDKGVQKDHIFIEKLSTKKKRRRQGENGAEGDTLDGQPQAGGAKTATPEPVVPPAKRPKVAAVAPPDHHGPGAGGGGAAVLLNGDRHTEENRRLRDHVERLKKTLAESKSSVAGQKAKYKGLLDLIKGQKQEIAELQGYREATSAKLQCVQCRRREMSIILHPCGHGLCEGCYKGMSSVRPECPECRTHVAHATHMKNALAGEGRGGEDLARLIRLGSVAGPALHVTCAVHGSLDFHVRE